MGSLPEGRPEHLRSFELEDGSRHHYDPMKAGLFLHSCECLRAHDRPERPEPPELLKAMARAKDRQALVSEVAGHYADISPYEWEAFA